MATSTSLPISAPQIKSVRVLQFMRGLWWLIAAMGFLLFIAVIPFNWHSFLTVPSSYNIIPDQYSIYAPPLQEGLAQLRIPVSVYAAFKMLVSASILTIFYAMGFLIFRTRFQERIGMQAAFCFVALGAFLSTATGDTPSYGIEWLDVFIDASGLLMALVGFGTVYLFLVVYPDGRLIPRWAVIAPITWLMAIIPVILNPNAEFGGGDVSPVFPMLFAIGAIAVPLAAQIYRYIKVSTVLQRQQTKWFISAIAVLLLISTFPTFIAVDRLQPVQAVLADLGDVFSNVILLLIPFTVGVAILRYRLWDIDLVINKSLVYGIVLGLALAFFTAVLAALQIIIGQSQPLAALVIAVVVSGLLFNPAQKRVQNLVDRYLYHFRFDLNDLAAVHKERQITRPGTLTGKIMGGYEAGNLIGKGGMGEIYRGFNDNQVVAIKTLLPEFVQDKDLRARFQREIETGKSLKHRSVAEVYDSGEVDGTPYLIMEYIEGQDLNSILRRDGAFDDETTTQIMQDICSALDAVHQVGFVHRDLKPANIMLRPNGEAVLMDFGVTKAAETRSSLTGTGAIGTIDYMAPEQIMSSKSVDQRADIYALGIVAFELLTGEKPFKGSPGQVMFAHIQQPAPFARDINPDIPLKMAEAIERALAKNPDDRFDSAGAFANSL